MTDEQRLKIKEAIYSAYDGTNAEEIREEVKYSLEMAAEDHDE